MVKRWMFYLMMVLCAAAGAAYAQGKPPQAPPAVPPPVAQPADSTRNAAPPQFAKPADSTQHAAPPPVAKPVEAPMVSSATIVLGDKATTHGEIQFDFTPAGGETKQVVVTVAKKKGKDVAKDIEKAFKIVVGPNFKVERGPGQVKIKGNKKGVMFRLTLVTQTAKGLTVRIQ